MSEEMKQAICNLKGDDRDEALRLLSGERPAKPDVKERFADMESAIRTVTGEPLEFKSRRACMVWRRAMVSYRLALEGYSENAISRVVRRDHSTVNNMKRMMRDAISVPAAYRDVLDTYNAFVSAL